MRTRYGWADTIDGDSFGLEEFAQRANERNTTVLRSRI